MKEHIEISVSGLGHGMNLHFIKSDKFKRNTMSILMRRPLARETVTPNALIPFLLGRGCEKYPETPGLIREKERLYGGMISVNSHKKGEEQLIECYMDIVNNRTAQDRTLLAQGLELAASMLLNPLVRDGGFDAEYVNSEKSSLKTLIESRINNKSEYAKTRLIEIMCEGEPFALYPLGYAEDLESRGLEGKPLWEYYKDMLRTSHMDFMFMGAADEEGLKSDISELFRRETADFIDIKPASLARRKHKARRVHEHADIAQGKLCVGLGADGEPPDYYSLLMASQVLGGDAGSRLFASVREKNSLCYYINSFVVRSKDVIVIQSGVDAKNFDKTIELISAEVETLKAKGVRDEELSRAKSGMVKRFTKIKDEPAQMLDFYVSQLVMGADYGLDEAIRRIGGVTAEDVCAAASRLYIDTIYTYGRENP